MNSTPHRAPDREGGAAPRALRTLTGTAGAQRGWRALFVVLVATVCWLALTPAPPPDLSTGWDKLNHTLAFASLAFTGRLGLATKRAPWWLPVTLLLFGGLIELLQLAVPGRSSEWADLLADAIGLAAGWVLACWILRMTEPTR